jgi:repressor LexA
MTSPLTRRQFQVLQAFADHQLETQLAPTLEELGQKLGVNRVTVYGHIQALLQKQCLENLMPGASRGLDLTASGRQALIPTDQKGKGHFQQNNPQTMGPSPFENASPPASEPSAAIPLLGKIAAGGPILALEEKRPVHLPSFLGVKDSTYLLQVSGDSMIEANINDQDLVLIDREAHPKANDIVVAILKNAAEEECTLKHYLPQKNGLVILKPANQAYSPIAVPGTELEVRGVVTGVIRSLK